MTGWLDGVITGLALLLAAASMLTLYRWRVVLSRRVRRLEREVRESRTLIRSLHHERLRDREPSAADVAGADAPPVTPVFILSLPRAGSTLLRRMLARHPSIATAPEPWVLLPMVYGHVAERRGATAEYDERLAAEAVSDFLDLCDLGSRALTGDIRERAAELYRAAAFGRPLFLDKTPRYALIAGRLPELFPQARFVVLWRSPLAVYSSVRRTWPDEPFGVAPHEIDLRAGLAGLCRLVQDHPGRVHTLRYEDLLSDTEHEMRRVCDAIGVPFDSRVLRPARGAHDPTAGTRLGDRTGRAELREVRDRPSTLPGISNERRRAWCRAWLEWVGDARLGLMGYDPAELRQQLESLRLSGAEPWKDRRRDRRGRAWLAQRARLTGRTPEQAADALARGEWPGQRPG